MYDNFQEVGEASWNNNMQDSKSLDRIQCSQGFHEDQDCMQISNNIIIMV